jgi:hypothetical protein
MLKKIAVCDLCGQSIEVSELTVKNITEFEHINLNEMTGWAEILFRMGNITNHVLVCDKCVFGVIDFLKIPPPEPPPVKL